MTSETAKTESPSTKLIAALQQYTEELEAIKASLDTIMILFELMREQNQKEIHQFAEQHGKDIDKDENSIRFKLSADKITDYQRIDFKIRTLNSSQRLMPRNLLVALVCSYDAFLGKLIRFILETKPGILDSSDRQISFSDLQQFDSIGTAREYIIEKEIETVLRKSHSEHFKWLETKLDTPFNKNLESWPRFVELTERRNLFVHADGIVSSQYLKTCTENKCFQGECPPVGKRLEVTQKYFLESYQCLYEIGVKLAHVIWRKILKQELKTSDSNISEITYNLILKREYAIAIKILLFFTEPKMAKADEASHKTQIINLAQAYKWNKQTDECIAILNKHDWSASQLKFSLTVAVLKEEWDNVFVLMKKIRHDPDFDKSNYKHWPVFKNLRKHEKFPSVYQECYNEPFSSQEEITNTSDSLTNASNKQGQLDPLKAVEPSPASTTSLPPLANQEQANS